MPVTVFFEHGQVVGMQPAPKTSCYEERELINNATLIVSDGVLYDLTDANSIHSIPVPDYLEVNEHPVSSDMGVTGYLDYVLRMHSGCLWNNGEYNLSISCLRQACLLMLYSPIAWQRKDYYRIVNAPFKVEVGAFKGQEYGVIMGTDYVYDDNGNKVVQDDGLYASTSGNVPLGSVYPKLTGGFLNTFNYKNLSLSVLFDGQRGGKFFSTSYMWGIYSGMLEETADNNELGIPKRNDPEENGGVLLPGVFADGTPNDVRVDAETWGGSMYSGPAAQSVFKSDFVKLREITIGYRVPLKSKYISNLNISAYGRNLALWGPDTKHFDPESATTSSGNIQGIEGGALPSLATFGLNVGFQF